MPATPTRSTEGTPARRTLCFWPIRGGGVSIQLSTEAAWVLIATDDGEEGVARQIDFEPDGRSEALAECRNVLKDALESVKSGWSAADLIREWSPETAAEHLVEAWVDAEEEN